MYNVQLFLMFHYFNLFPCLQCKVYERKKLLATYCKIKNNRLTSEIVFTIVQVVTSMSSFSRSLTFFCSTFHCCRLGIFPAVSGLHEYMVSCVDITSFSSVVPGRRNCSDRQDLACNSISFPTEVFFCRSFPSCLLYFQFHSQELLYSPFWLTAP